MTAHHQQLPSLTTKVTVRVAAMIAQGRVIHVLDATSDAEYVAMSTQAYDQLVAALAQRPPVQGELRLRRLDATSRPGWWQRCLRRLAGR